MGIQWFGRCEVVDKELTKWREEWRFWRVRFPLSLARTRETKKLLVAQPCGMTPRKSDLASPGRISCMFSVS